MSVTIRKRRLSDGRSKIFIDVYDKGRRQFQFTELILGKDRQYNKTILAIAEQLRNKIELELLSGRYDFVHQDNNSNFFEFAETFARTKNEGNRKVFDHCINHLQKYVGGKTLRFIEITPTFCSKFVQYLKTTKLKTSVDQPPSFVPVRELDFRLQALAV